MQISEVTVNKGSCFNAIDLAGHASEVYECVLENSKALNSISKINLALNQQSYEKLDS